MDTKETCVRKLSILKEHEYRQKKSIVYFFKHSFGCEDRLVIIDWMHASCVFFRFEDPVFFYAVGYFDLTLSWREAEPFGTEELQCLAACCLWTAVGEVTGPDALTVRDMLDWNEDDPFCTKKNLLTMYEYVNQRFKYRTFIVTPYDFLVSFLTILEMSNSHNLTWMAFYLLELSQYSYKICLNDFQPSLIAAASLFAGLRNLKLVDSMIPDLTILTGYADDDPDLLDVAEILSSFFLKAAIGGGKYKSVYRKYSLAGRKCVAQIIL